MKHIFTLPGRVLNLCTTITQTNNHNSQGEGDHAMAGCVISPPNKKFKKMGIREQNLQRGTWTHPSGETKQDLRPSIRTINHGLGNTGTLVNKEASDTRGRPQAPNTPGPVESLHRTAPSQAHTAGRLPKPPPLGSPPPQLSTRPSKCLQHHQQRWCKIFWTGVIFLLLTYSVLSLIYFLVQTLHIVLLKLLIFLIFLFNKLVLCFLLYSLILKTVRLKYIWLNISFCCNLNFDKMCALFGINFVFLKSCWCKVLDI